MESSEGIKEGNLWVVVAEATDGSLKMSDLA